MYRSPGHAALAVLAGLAALAPLPVLTSCGGGGGSDDVQTITIAMDKQALLSDASLLLIYFFDDTAQTCDGVRAAMPRPAAVVGPFQAVLQGSGAFQGITAKINDVPIGAYVVFVDALDAVGNVVGTGCAPHQVVSDRKLARIKITVS
jgi:hypothetical protein